MFSDFQMTIDFWRVSRLRLFILLVTAACK